MNHEELIKKIKDKIDELNLKHNLIYIEKNEITKEFLDKLKKSYNINILLENTPIAIVIIDEEVVKNISVTPDTNVDVVIDYEVFEWLI